LQGHAESIRLFPIYAVMTAVPGFALSAARIGAV
jgi:hypothetical protein